MYGGHITDAWDRRTCNSYLSVLVNEKLFSGLELGPGFASPNPTELDYKDYLAYVEERLPPGQTLISCHQYPEFFVYLSFTLLPIYLSTYRINGLSACLSVCVSACLSVCLYLPAFNLCLLFSEYIPSLSTIRDLFFHLFNQIYICVLLQSGLHCPFHNLPFPLLFPAFISFLNSNLLY